jgi:hypothetical protein
MENCEGGDLNTLIRKKKAQNEKFTEYVLFVYSCSFFWSFAGGCINALRYMHGPQCTPRHEDAAKSVFGV